MTLFTDEELGIDSGFPCAYHPPGTWGWSGEDADEFLALFEDWSYCDRIIAKSGLIQRRKGLTFAYDPEHTQVRGAYDAMLQTVDEDHCHGPVLPSSEAPDKVRKLASVLTARLHEMPGYEPRQDVTGVIVKRQINFLSLQYYRDHAVQIGWHDHSEDRGVDTPVFIVSTGKDARPFHLMLQNDKSKQWSKSAEHGSLIVMPASFNDTHFHAVLPEKNPCGVRISIVGKILTPPRVWCCRKGHPHPKYAQYVGCGPSKWGGGCQCHREVLQKGTIYGNDHDPFHGHNNWIARNEAGFREYAEKKMLDPAFRAQAIKDLHGKHLLCWCIQDGPERAPFCHARVWLDVVNRPEGKT